MAGGVPVVVETTEASGFNLTPQQLRQAITPKTKALILNSPSNPTGMIYSRSAPGGHCPGVRGGRPLCHRR